jgi:hypothetical protein
MHDDRKDEYEERCRQQYDRKQSAGNSYRILYGGYKKDELVTITSADTDHFPAHSVCRDHFPNVGTVGHIDHSIPTVATLLGSTSGKSTLMADLLVSLCRESQTDSRAVTIAKSRAPSVGRTGWFFDLEAGGLTEDFILYSRRSAQMAVKIDPLTKRSKSKKKCKWDEKPFGSPPKKKIPTLKSFLKKEKN